MRKRKKEMEKEMDTGFIKGLLKLHLRDITWKMLLSSITLEF